MPDPGLSTGALSGQSAVRSLDLGDVRVTYVPDGAMGVQPSGFFPGVPAWYWAEHPEALDARGRVAMSAGGLLVERGDETLLIDAGYGECSGKTATGTGEVNSGALPGVLKSLGRDPGQIGAVAFTHLHIDHTGWAFTPGSGPAFPRARYIMAAAEWAPYARGETVKAASGPEVIGQFAATDLTLIDDGAEVFPGVTALVTPGHSPGHTSYVITGSTGTRVIALGDIFHIPAQIAHPQWPSLPDFDGEGVLAARGRLLGELRRPGTVGFACHFGDRAFGRIKPDEDGRPGWEPVPAAVLGPPPRLLD